MTQRLALSLGVVMLLASGPAAQDAPFVRHDLDALPWVQLTPQLRVKTVVGRVGTFAFGEFAAGPTRTAHHHTVEQINVGFTGTSAIRVADRRLELGQLGATLVPDDVEHVLENSGVASTLIEFQPFRRLDLLPERSRVAVPVGPVALSVPPDWPLTADLSSSSAGWSQDPRGVSRKSLKGMHAAVALWRVPAGTTTFDLALQLPGAEQFVYVLDGTVGLERAGTRVDAKSHNLFVSGPDATPFRATGSGQAATLLVLEATPVETR